MNKHTIPIINKKLSPDNADKYWPLFDLSRRGYLSLDDVIKGVKNVLDLPELAKLDPVVSRAYNASKSKLKSLTKFGDENISKGQFGFFLQYLKQYAYYWYVFDSIDTSNDHRITKNEFIKAIPRLKQMGMMMEQPQEVFKEISTNNGEKILFEDFCRYANAQKLSLNIK